MRLLKIVALCLLAMALAPAALAVDEFGQRFTTESPAALQDEKTPEQALSEVAPAAGDEEADQGAEGEEIQNQDEPAETPAQQ